MNNFLKGFLISFGVALLVFAATFLFNNPRDGLMAGATLIVLMSPVYLLVGIILVCIQSTRQAGAGVLASAGIMLLVGLSICSSGSIFR